MSNYNKWIELGLKKGLSDIEIHINEKVDLGLNVYEGKVEQNEISKMQTASIKGIFNNKAANVYVENLTDSNIELMLDRLLDSAKNITSNEPAIIFEGSKEYVKINEPIFDFSKIDPKDKVKLLLDLEAGIYKNEFVKKVSTTFYGETELKTTIINSKGLNLSRHSTVATIYASGVYEKEGQIKSGLSYQIVKNFNEINVDKLIDDNIKNGTSQLGAKTISSSKYPVVFDNEQFGNVLAVFASIFSGEAAFRNLTKLNGKQGTKIASPIVNLVDSPFHEKALMKVPFDDEGVACETRHWIKDGVFTDFNHNLKTAAIFNTKSTGNGFGRGIKATNLVLEPQEYTLNEVLDTIQHGIYITDLVGLHAGVETVSGDFSLQAAGFEINDGKLGRPIDMIVVSGNFFELLNNIEMIANNLIFGLSGVGTGAVKISELTVAGE